MTLNKPPDDFMPAPEVDCNAMRERLKAILDEITAGFMGLIILFDRIIALEKELSIKVVRRGVAQWSIGWQGIQNTRTQLWGRSDDFAGCSDAELAELIAQAEALIAVVPVLSSTFEQHLAFLMGYSMDSAGIEGPDARMTRAQVHLAATNMLSVAIRENADVLKDFRQLNKVDLLSTIYRNRSQIGLILLMIGTVATRACDSDLAGCHSKSAEPREKSGEYTFLDPDLID